MLPAFLILHLEKKHWKTRYQPPLRWEFFKKESRTIRFLEKKKPNWKEICSILEQTNFTAIWGKLKRDEDRRTALVPFLFFFFFSQRGMKKNDEMGERKKKKGGRKVARSGFERTGAELTFGVFFLISPPRFFIPPFSLRGRSDSCSNRETWAVRFVRIFE